MLVPSGSAWSTSTVAPSARSTSGADRATPHRWRSRRRRGARRGRGPPSDADDRRRSQRSTPRRIVVATEPARHRAARGGLVAEQRVQLGLERRPPRRRSACAPRARTASRRCRGTGCATPRSPPPSTPSAAADHATAGVGTTPSSTTSTPSAASPDASAASSSGPRPPRVAPDHARPSAGSVRAAARPSASDELGRELREGDAAHAVGAELQHRRSVPDAGAADRTPGV